MANPSSGPYPGWMTGFFEIFEPGLRHMREQKDLEKILIVEADKGGTGPQPLDLDSGSVTLRVPPQAVPEPSPPVPTDP